MNNNWDDLLPDEGEMPKPAVKVTNFDAPAPTQPPTQNAAPSVDSEDEGLTPEQMQKIVDMWNADTKNPPSLKALTMGVFGGEFDGRSKEGRAIKAFLASRKLRAKAASDPTQSIEIELNDAHKAYITNNASKHTAVEMARELFHNPNLTNLNAETRAVNALLKTLDAKVVYSSAAMADVPEGNYKPPNTFDQVFKKVNEFLNYSLDKDKLTAAQRKELNQLVNYLHTYRFIHQMNNYDSENDRRLCEDAFVRATYDKGDLMQEEVDQYIEYANQVVMGTKVERRKNQLEDRLSQILSSTDNTDTRVQQGFADALKAASTEYNQCKIRENKMLSDLKLKRSQRLSKAVSENASILNLVHAWKMEESRLEWIRHGEIEQESVGEEIDKLTSLPEMIARIFGLVKEEVKNS